MCSHSWQYSAINPGKATVWVKDCCASSGFSWPQIAQGHKVTLRGEKNLIPTWSIRLKLRFLRYARNAIGIMIACGITAAIYDKWPDSRCMQQSLRSILANSTCSSSTDDQAKVRELCHQTSPWKGPKRNWVEDIYSKITKVTPSSNNVAPFTTTGIELLQNMQTNK